MIGVRFVPLFNFLIEVNKMQDSIFYNTDVLFIEVYDILINPHLQMLKVNVDNPSLTDIFDFSPVRYLSNDGLHEWYKNRRNFNPFIDLLRPNRKLSDSVLSICDTMIDMDNRFIKVSDSLNFYSALYSLLHSASDLVEEIIFYTPNHSKNVAIYLKEIMDKRKVTYYYGDLLSCLPKSSKSVTYVFSDIEHVLELQEANKLHMSSVLIPAEYRYNKKSYFEYKVDLAKMKETNIFKYNFFQSYPF